MSWNTMMTEFDNYEDDSAVKKSSISLWAKIELEFRGMCTNDSSRAINCLKKELALGEYASMYLQKKSGKKVSYKDCWDTQLLEYSKEVLDDFFGNILLPYVFEWMATQLHSRS